MKPDNETIKEMLRDLQPVVPPERLTANVLNQIQNPVAARQSQPLAWVFFVTGFFFFSLFIILAAGVQFWAEKGLILQGLNMVRNSVFAVSILMATAGLGLTHGGKWGLYIANAVAVIMAVGFGLSSIGLSMRAGDLPAAMAVLGFGGCGIAMALILLKGLRRNENHG